MKSREEDYYMIENRKAGIINFFLIVLLIVCIVVFLVLGYIYYQNLPGEPVNGTIDLEKPASEIPNSPVNQFYQNMKFNHNQISYQIDSNCELTKTEKMTRALKEISDNVPEISFYQSSENPDIEFSCTEKSKDSVAGKEYFVAGEGGAKEIIQTGNYNVITNGVVLLYGNPNNALKCDFPNVELHEIMHVFGFNHTTDKNSLMYPYLESCDQKIDQKIIDELKRLYSEKNLPELYFDSVLAIKKGRYLDFNITIKNSGVIDANDVNYSIYDEGKLIESRKIGDLKFGGGVYLQVQNLKLLNRDSKQVSFVIDSANLIDEMNKSNNEAVVKFS